VTDADRGAGANADAGGPDDAAAPAHDHDHDHDAGGSLVGRAVGALVEMEREGIDRRGRLRAASGPMRLDVGYDVRPRAFGADVDDSADAGGDDPGGVDR
jgi:hypothetical protein